METNYNLDIREDLLHFIWQHKKMQLRDLQTTKGERILINSVGTHNTNTGPDFFNAKLKIGEQLWAGNVELHIKASDWYAHNHEKDENYNNVILHIVWEDDASIFRADNSEIPTLELKKYISQALLKSYKILFNTKDRSFINCEKDISTIDDFLLKNWLERLYFERLERKTLQILEMLVQSNNNWEQVLFLLLLKTFGSTVNGTSFLSIANTVGYAVFKKVNADAFKAESILFGVAGLLNNDAVLDTYYLDLKREYAFLKNKFSLEEDAVEKAAFFRLRPTNFPTIRLSQISNLYAKHQTLFSKLMEAASLAEIYEVFNVSANMYWDTHFTFGKISKKSKKKLTRSFVNLVIINVILPLKFCYARHIGKDENETILKIISSLSKEKNNVVRSFSDIKLKISNAKESQAILQLYNEYCSKNKCIQCAIGSSLLSKE